MTRQQFHRVYLDARRQRLLDEAAFAAVIFVPVCCWVAGVLLIVYGWPF